LLSKKKTRITRFFINSSRTPGKKTTIDLLIDRGSTLCFGAQIESVVSVCCCYFCVLYNTFV
jgi:hypothetical protein